MAPIETAPPTTESAPEAPEAPKTTGRGGPRGPRGPRGSRGAKEGEDNVLYCLDTGKGESGAIALSQPGPKMEIVVQAFKSGVHYYRLEKFRAQVANEGGKYEIVGVPAE